MALAPIRRPPAAAAHLSCLTLGVKDLSAARRFYEALGFKVGLVHEGDVVFFQMQGSILGLYVQAKLSRDLKLKGAPRPGGMNPAMNLPSAKAVDALFAKALKAGAKALRSPCKADWGGYSGLFADKDGHPWELAHNPFWKLDAKGRVRL